MLACLRTCLRTYLHVFLLSRINFCAQIANQCQITYKNLKKLQLGYLLAAQSATII